MKRRLISLFVFLTLALPFISAIDISMPTNVPQGQTVIASVQGNFLDAISKSNIHFYRNYVETSFDYDVARIGDTYYIYFQTLNKPQNNYSINISGVRYYVGSQISSETISKSFTINSEQADFYVNKGFVQTYGNFSITLQNLNPSSITVTIQTKVDSGSDYGFFDFLFKSNPVPADQTISLYSGEIQDVDVNLGSINETTIRTVTFSTNNTKYDIPVYVIFQTSSNNTISGNNTTTNSSAAGNNSNTLVNETKNETSGGSFWDIFKKPNKTETSENNSSSNITVIINQTTNTTSLVVNGTTVANNTALKTCAEIKGDICTANEEVCDGTTVTAKDNLCCIGTCTAKPKSNTGKIIGWSIIGLIVILLIIFKMKLSKTRRKKVDLLKVPPKKF